MRPIERVRANLEGVEERGDGALAALCPAHQDRQPSLSVSEGDGGKVLLRCFAGCSTADVLAAAGLDWPDLFPGGEGGGPVRASKGLATAQGCTLEDYAKAKRLPKGHLASLGLSEITYAGATALRIPYKGADGEERAVRFRVALHKSAGGDDRFKWRKGSKLTLYGLWRLEEAKGAGYVLLVEGESDCHTLWFHGYPALGVPGANSWRGEWADHFEGIEKVYAVVEPDSGGKAFWEKLAASALRERLYRAELEAPDGQG